MTIIISLLALLSSNPELPAQEFHDFHISYGQLAVEGNIAMLRIRFFQDDLEQALKVASGDPSFELSTSRRADSIFVAYANDTIGLASNGVTLQATLSSSGEDTLDREPMWWYLLRYDASESIESLELRNSLLLSMFRDQKNIVKVAHYPDDKRQSFYFAEGEETVVIDF